MESLAPLTKSDFIICLDKLNKYISCFSQYELPKLSNIETEYFRYLENPKKYTEDSISIYYPKYTVFSRVLETTLDIPELNHFKNNNVMNAIFQQLIIDCGDSWVKLPYVISSDYDRDTKQTTNRMHYSSIISILTDSFDNFTEVLSVFNGHAHHLNSYTLQEKLTLDRYKCLNISTLDAKYLSGQHSKAYHTQKFNCMSLICQYYGMHGIEQPACLQEYWENEIDILQTKCIYHKNQIEMKILELSEFEKINAIYTNRISSLPNYQELMTANNAESKIIRDRFRDQNIRHAKVCQLLTETILSYRDVFECVY